MEQELKDALHIIARKPFLISGVMQHYAWGRTFENSILPALIGETAPLAGIPKHYAELWYGAHPKGPSPILAPILAPLLAHLPGSSGMAQVTLLDAVVQLPKALLGENVHQRYSELPFLFKVLSVGRALSIQAHPDSALAKDLHTKDPVHYPDDRHKPEIGVALSPVSLLYGFCPLGKTLDSLSRYKPLEQFFGKEALAEARASLIDSGLTDSNGSQSSLASSKRRELFARCFSAPREEVETCCTELLAIFSSLETRSEAEDWFLRLAKDFPLTDVGLLGVFFLNLVTLAPEEAVFIGPNIPHAYLEGELIECMANSDNVVRAGLTEKFCDVSTLLSMLSFDEQRARRVTPVSAHGINWYRSAAEEFSLGTIKGPQKDIVLPAGVPSLCVVIEGSATLEVQGVRTVLKRGQASFIAAEAEKLTLSLENGFVAIATCPGRAPCP